jgi:hypothetical protein
MGLLHDDSSFLSPTASTSGFSASLTTHELIENFSAILPDNAA